MTDGRGLIGPKVLSPACPLAAPAPAAASSSTMRLLSWETTRCQGSGWAVTRRTEDERMTEEPVSAIGESYPSTSECSDSDIAAAVMAVVERFELAGKSIVVLVPDGTRSAPMARIARVVEATLMPWAASVTWLVALGTHQPMSTEALALHLGPVTGTVRNHDWADDGTFVSLGSIGSSEMAELTNGRLDEEVEVRINRLVAEADAALVCGPVFPHEVVGYSGGNKYFFPGVSGPEVIDATHWLGALHTSRALIGTLGVTPVRAVIDRAASMVPTLRCATCFVVAPGGTRLAGIFPGTPEESFAAAAALSAEVHVRWLDHPVRRVISILPERYDDMWTGAKGMYKVEPVVRDGGEVLLFAPHITEFSRTHGALLAEIGYHVRDYFVGQWGSFSRIPGRVLAHSTHLRGDGTWSEDGGERPRITVTLATGIDEDRCRQHGLGYLDPAAVDLAALRADPDEDLLVVEEAGETLYRLRPDSSRTAAASSPSSASSG